VGSLTVNTVGTDDVLVWVTVEPGITVVAHETLIVFL